MRLQGLDHVVGPCQFSLRQSCEDLVVTNLVQKYGRPALAAAQFRDEVVQALPRFGRNRAKAEGTDRIAHGM